MQQWVGDEPTSPQGGQYQHASGTLTHSITMRWLTRGRARASALVHTGPVRFLRGGMMASHSFSLCCRHEHVALVWETFPSRECAFWLCNMSLPLTDSFSLGPDALWSIRQRWQWEAVPPHDRVGPFPCPARGAVITAPDQRERAPAAVGHVIKRGLAFCSPRATEPSLREARQNRGRYRRGTGGPFHARNGGTGPVLTPSGGSGTGVGAFCSATAVLWV